MFELVTDNIQGRLDELVVEQNEETKAVQLQLYYAVTPEEFGYNLRQLKSAIKTVDNVHNVNNEEIHITLVGETAIFYFNILE